MCFLPSRIKIFVVFILFLFAYCVKEQKSVEDDFDLKNTLLYGIPQQPSSLDPAESSDLIYTQIAFNIFETLIQYDWDSGKYLPALAISWEKSEDGLAWIFHLRPGVKFHDGSALDALAVKKSFNRQIDSSCLFYQENITDTYGKFALNMIEKINIIDELTIQFKLKFPCSFFLDNIASPYFTSIVSPTALKKYGNQFGLNPCGTGPFKLRQWKQGKSIVLEKFNKYWGKSSQIENVLFKIVPDLKERFELLKRQELDIAIGLSASSINQLYYNPEINILTPKVFGTYFLGFMCQNKPFDDLRIRKAISLAIDVKSLVSSLSRGFAVVAQGPLPAGILSYHPLIKQEGYNIEQAIKLMEQAGYPHGLKAELCYFIQTDTLRANPLSQYIKSQLNKIGITLKVLAYNDWSIYYKEVLVQDKTDMFLEGFPTFTRDADNFLYALFHSKSRSNFFKYSNTRVDRLLEQARQTMEVWERRKLYQDVQQIIVNEIPAVFLSHPSMGYAIRERVKNFKTDPTMIVRLNEVELRDN